MTAEQTHEFNLTHPTVEQGRPVWKHEDYFIEKGKEFPVTALVCQKNSKELIQITLESLLRFYPDLNILVVDDNSTDDSVQYLEFMQLTNPNLKVWFRKGEYWGHGLQMHRAITDHIKTEYAFIIDSDVAFMRGGFLEEMLLRFQENPKLYAIGVLQYSSYKNNGGEPESPEDAIPYGNPHGCLYHLPTYHKLDAPFITDGTPCILNMKAAHDSGLEVEYYPMDKYQNHLSGGSWVTPKTIWNDDMDVRLRPFLTIITDGIIPILSDSDFDIVPISFNHKGEYVFTDGSQKFKVNNGTFKIRFNVYGEYVLDFSNQDSKNGILQTFLIDLKKKVIEEKVPDEIEVDGFKCYRRKYWQQTKSVQ